jgi:hypothetical protein
MDVGISCDCYIDEQGSRLLPFQSRGTTLMDVSANDVAWVILPDGRKGGRREPEYFQRAAQQEAAHKEVCTHLGLNNGVFLRLGRRHGQLFPFSVGAKMTNEALRSCLGHTTVRNYDNPDHIWKSQLPGVSKHLMTMNYKLVVSCLKAMPKDEFKRKLLGMKQVKGQWRWPNGDAV